MSLHTRSGTRVTLAAIDNVTDPVTDPDPYVTVTEDIIERTEFSGGNDAASATGDDMTVLAFRAGEQVRKSEITDRLSPASVAAFAPATGLAAAGGTVISATGAGLDGVTAVTVGGTAATAVTQVNPRLVRFTTPAKAAGTYPVVLTDDSGTVTKAAALTFV